MPGEEESGGRGGGNLTYECFGRRPVMQRRRQTLNMTEAEHERHDIESAYHRWPGRAPLVQA